MENSKQSIPSPAFESWLLRELADIKASLLKIQTAPEITSSWLPRSDVMQFFDYGDTQMAALEKGGQLVVSKVGNRKFIHRDSVLRLLETCIQQS